MQEVRFRIRRLPLLAKLAGILLLGLSLSLLVSGLVVSRIVDRFEQRELYNRGAQFGAFLDRELANLNSLAASFAEWNEARLFLENPDFAFMDATYTDSWLLSTRIDYVAMLAADGTLVWSSLDRREREQAQRSGNGQSGQLPLFNNQPGTASAGGSGDSRVDRADLGLFGQPRFDLSDRRLFPPGLDKPDYQPCSGFMPGAISLFMYSVWPVTDDFRKLLPKGFLLFARRMDASRISSYLSTPYVQAYFEPRVPEGYTAFPVRPVDRSGELVHYQVVTDLQGLVLGAWALSLQRVWRDEAMVALRWFWLFLFVLCLAALILLRWLIRAEVWLPLARLDTGLNASLVRPEEPLRLPAASDPVLVRLFNHVAELMARQQSQSAELARLAGNDSLTGLPNRRRMMEYVETEVRRILRQGYDQDEAYRASRHGWLALVLLDLDYFRQYNDTYGHPAGDACLRGFGVLLREALKRTSDLPCRLGSDSFALVLPETNEKGALVTARRLAEHLKSQKIPHRSSVVAPYLSASFGVAAVRVDEQFNLELLLALADRALVTAKEQGRNRVAGIRPNR